MEFDRFDNAIYTAEEIVAQLKASPEWDEFTAKFDMESAPNKTLLSMLFDEKLGNDPDLKDYQRLLKSVLQAGGVVRVSIGQCEFETVPEPEPVVEPEVVPTDRNGRPLTPAQIAWSEYRTFSESNSMEVCRQRAKTDAGYGSFFRKQYERQTGEVADAVDNLNQRKQVSAPQAEALVAWAAEYHRTPVEKLRQLKRADTNPFGFQEWNRMFEACNAAGLI